MAFGSKTGAGGFPRDPGQKKDVRTRRALQRLAGTSLYVEGGPIFLDSQGRFALNYDGSTLTSVNGQLQVNAPVDQLILANQIFGQ